MCADRPQVAAVPLEFVWKVWKVWKDWKDHETLSWCIDIDKPPTSFGLSIFVRVPVGFVWKGNETLRWCIDKLPTSFGFRILVAVPIEFLCKEGRAQNTALAHR